MLLHPGCCASWEITKKTCARVVPGEGLLWGHCLSGLHVSGKASLEKGQQSTDPKGYGREPGALTLCSFGEGHGPPGAGRPAGLSAR